MEKWSEIRKGGNFMEMAKKYGIDPLIARIIRNRDIIDEKDITENRTAGRVGAAAVGLAGDEC